MAPTIIGFMDMSPKIHFYSTMHHYIKFYNLFNREINLYKLMHSNLKIIHAILQFSSLEELIHISWTCHSMQATEDCQRPDIELEIHGGWRPKADLSH